MKVVFTTDGNDLHATLDRRFGRCRNFIVYDTETRQFQTIPNHQNRNAAQGAGIQAAMTVAAAEADALITGHCGPNAFRVLKEAGIRVYSTSAPTVQDALREWLLGKSLLLENSDVEGHWV